MRWGFYRFNRRTNTPYDLDNIHKIQHVVIIMQENRSFDSYFGTFPGVDGIPMQNGEPSVCVQDPETKQCLKPYHDTNDRNTGGPHGAKEAFADIDGGKPNASWSLPEHLFMVSA